jgi:ASC-1-like (ASCH) protein
MNMVHGIKLSMHYADAVYYGEKNFEVRYNDRGYQKGDEIRFKVVDDAGVEISHPLNKIKYEITYLIHAVGLKEGWCAFGIREIKIPEEAGT